MITRSRWAVSSIMVGLLLVAVLSGCFSHRDATDSDGAEKAVTALISAAMDNDVDAAKDVVLSDMTDEDIAVNLVEIASFINSSGGIHQIVVRNMPSEQLGAISRVKVDVVDSSEARYFDVMQDGKTFTVIPWSRDGSAESTS